MARQQTDPYNTDKEKRDLAIARTEEAKSRTTQRQGDPYTQARGFPNLATMTEAESSSEKRATNQRLTENAAQNSKIEALKALSIAGVGSPHGQAALDELARVAGVKIPKTVDPKQAKLNELRKAKGLPPLGGAEEQPTSGAQQNQSEAPQQDQSLFQPQNYGGGLVQESTPGTQPVPSRIEGEATLGNPITPHLGTGGALITPENPTGNLNNPWGAGGDFANNPTHLAAINVLARDAAAHPYGSDSGANRSQTYFPGEAVDRLAGGAQPSRLVTPPTPTPKPPVMAGRNVPPNESILPTPANTWHTEGNVLPPPSVGLVGPQGSGWNVRPGGSLGQDWLKQIQAGQNVVQPKRKEPVY